MWILWLQTQLFPISFFQAISQNAITPVDIRSIRKNFLGHIRGSEYKHMIEDRERRVLYNCTNQNMRAIENSNIYAAELLLHLKGKCIC